MPSSFSSPTRPQNQVTRVVALAVTIIALLLLSVAAFYLNQFRQQRLDSQRNQFILAAWQEQLLTATPAAVSRDLLHGELRAAQQRFGQASGLLPGVDMELAVLQRIQEAAKLSRVELTSLQPQGTPFQEGALVGSDYAISVVGNLEDVTNFAIRLEEEAFPAAYFAEDVILNATKDDQYVFAGSLTVYGSTLSNGSLIDERLLEQPIEGADFRERATQAVRVGDYELALSLLLQYKALEPQSAEVDSLLYETYVQYGNQMLAQERHELAKEQCEAAQKIDPNGSDALACLVAVGQQPTVTADALAMNGQTATTTPTPSPTALNGNSDSGSDGSSNGDSSVTATATVTPNSLATTPTLNPSAESTPTATATSTSTPTAQNNDTGNGNTGNTDPGNTDPGNGNTDSGNGNSGNTDSGNGNTDNTDPGNTDPGNGDTGNGNGDTGNGNGDTGNGNSGNTDSGNGNNGNTDPGNGNSGNTDPSQPNTPLPTIRPPQTRTPSLPPTLAPTATITKISATVTPVSSDEPKGPSLPPTIDSSRATSTPTAGSSEPPSLPNTPVSSNTPIPDGNPTQPPANTPTISVAPTIGVAPTTGVAPTVAPTPMPSNTPTIAVAPTVGPSSTPVNATATATATAAPNSSPTATVTTQATPTSAFAFTANAPSYLPNCGLTHIKGTIRDQASNTPIGGITVRVWSDDTTVDGFHPSDTNGEWDVVLADYARAGRWHIQVVNRSTGAILSERQTVFTDTGPCKPTESGHQVVIQNFFYQAGPGTPIPTAGPSNTPTISPTPSNTATPTTTPTATVTVSPTGTPIPAVYAKDETPDLLIPDGPNGQASSTLNVPVEVIIRQFRIHLNINHDQIEDLDIDLVHPDGTSIRLHAEGQGALDRWISLTGRDLAAIEGKSAQGNWTLKLVDRFQTETGRLLSWQIEIYP